MKRTGLFGGTFDPIHLGHTALAVEVMVAMCLDEVIFIPSGLAPHKDRVGASSADRYKMAALTAAILGKGFSVSDYELSKKGTSYSYLTLKYFRSKKPDDALFFIAGSDIFASIGKWQRWREIFELTNFIVADRTGDGFGAMLESIPPELSGRVVCADAYQGDKAGRIILFKMPPVDISSTLVRGCVADESCPELLLEEVYHYIKEKKLYTIYK